MAGEHVGEETDGVAEGPHQEGREELDRGHQQVEGLGHARREEDFLEVAGAVVAHADRDEHAPRDERQHQRAGHAGIGRHLEERDDLGDVADEDEEEERDQKRQVGLTAVADAGLRDLLVDERDDAFRDRAEAPGNEAASAGAEEEDRHRDDQAEEVDERDLVEREVGRILEQPRRPLDHVLDRREFHGSQKVHWCSLVSERSEIVGLLLA